MNLLTASSRGFLGYGGACFLNLQLENDEKNNVLAWS